MSLSEDHEDWNDPPLSHSGIAAAPGLDEDEDIDMVDPGQYNGSGTLEIDYIALPTLGKLGVRRSEYQSFPEESRVRKCIREVTKDGGLWYQTVFADGHMDIISFDKLLSLEGGPVALEGIGNDGPASTRASTKASTRNATTKHSRQTTVASSNGGNQDEERWGEEEGGEKEETGVLEVEEKQEVEEVEEEAEAEAEEEEGEEEEEEEEQAELMSIDSASLSAHELRRRKVANLARNRKAQITVSQSPSPSTDELSPQKGQSQRRTRSKPLKAAAMLPYRGQTSKNVAYDSDDDLIVSDLIQYTRRKSKSQSRNITRSSGRKRKQFEDSDFSEEEEHTRKSGRTTSKKNLYTEPGLEDEFMDVVVKATKARIVHAKEVFPSLDEDGLFVQFHSETCDTCGEIGDSRTRGLLVYCQGCSYSYHVSCIGIRSAREHLITKLAEDDFVLQCKRCVGRPHRKDPTAPRTDCCADCHGEGKSCAPFRSLIPPRKPKSTTASDISATVTPDVEVPRELVYNNENLLFRCAGCRRAWHYEHLPSRSAGEKGKSTITIAEKRLADYGGDWKCDECVNRTTKIHVIRAWRPSDPTVRETDAPETLDIENFNEDEREYLVKFMETSYFRAEWLPGAWVWGTHLALRAGFIKKGPMLAFTTEQAILESYLRVEIVFDVRYSSIVPTGKDMNVDLRRIGEVTEALVKYQGLTYEDVVWEVPPQDDGDKTEKGRYSDWKTAYENYVHGNYIHIPRGARRKHEVVKARKFEAKLEKKEQPAYITGGTLMKYQMDGMNWLYYKWWQGQTSILADEMGLGKTIQIISFLSIMVNDLNLWPFLIVVPHSTVPNWKREIERWCPSMRVVAYFGADRGRQLQRKYEMFHPGTKDLKCHIVVTSYTTPLSDALYLKSIPWEALIVDEGQRLKNDQSLLYKALEGYKIKHKILMTGTPLQNNPRELFNLLHFLDTKINAAELEEEFGELTRENVPRLHEMIRPFFLRRTKKEVLTFLPPMAEVIVPVTMTKLQRKLYKSILAKDPALIKSIFRNPGDKSKTGNLRNVLMQLRKVLSHPFFYSDAIEDRTFDPETLHQNLINAGSKFELLNIMLPKLKERGHRVLMFSQFLGMLDVMEDFLNGLGMSFQRLDGSTDTQEKQRRIDAYNAPGSKDFAFLLSTRAGGVGINLATADTVIILDPDFNPHQDIQALSRAHRIGQKNKVLVFHLVTRDTAEEKIMQIGKKKLSLDHLIIEKMGVEGDEEELVDVESVLKFGARALFEDEGDGAEEKRIKYDSEGVDRLLDRSTVEETKTTEVNGAENAFSFARVWANDKGTLEEGALGDDEGEADMETDFWDILLAEREENARNEAAKAAQELGRGKRRKKVDYSLPQDEYNDISPGKTKSNGAAQEESADDGDFRAEEDPETESDGGMELVEDIDMIALELRSKATSQTYQNMIRPGQPANQTGGSWQHPVQLPWENQHRQRMAHRNSNLPSELAVGLPYHPPIQPAPVVPMGMMGAGLEPAKPKADRAGKEPAKPRKESAGRLAVDRIFRRIDMLQIKDTPGATKTCVACKTRHSPGACKLKQMGVEFCPLCGIAHYGRGPTCPHLNDENNINAMLEALRESNEDPQMVKDAKAYLRGRKGALRKAADAKGPRPKITPDAKHAAQMAATNATARNA